MANQSMNTEQLKQAEACATMAKKLISQAMQECISNQAVAQEALKQAATEVAQCQTMISQIQSSFQTQSASK